MLAASQAVLPCTPIDVSLRKQYRRAERVFVGTVTEIADPPSASKNVRDREIYGIVGFTVETAWKGGVSPVKLFSDVAGARPCGKPDQFKVGQKYLIFASKDYVRFGDAEMLPGGESTVKRVKDPWFRMWATINPF